MMILKIFVFSLIEFQKNLIACELVLCNVGFELNLEVLSVR